MAEMHDIGRPWQHGQLPLPLADLIYEVDRQGRILDYHASHPELLHAAPKEFLGKTIEQTLPPQAGQALGQAVRDVVRTGQQTTIEYALRTKAGDGWFEATLIARGVPASSEGRILIILRDVTERKRAAQLLRESEDRHRIVLDQMQEAVVFADERDVIRHINAFACQYLNTTWDDAVGQDLIAFHPPGVRPRIKKILETFRADPNARVVARQRPLGDRQLIFRFSPVRDSRGNYRGIIANLIDVTEIRQLETRLQHIQHMESVARLAGGVAHDVNNLMVTVVALAEFARHHLGDDHPQTENLREIERAGERASELANQLVAYSRTGAYRPAQVNLNTVVQRATRFATATAPDTIRVELDLDDQLPDVRADPLQMEQAVLNLCRNAIEAISGKGCLRVRTYIDRLHGEILEVHPNLADADLVCLSVQDDGCGIDAETARRIFEPYYSTKSGGRGLGLASVHGIVNRHGGHVEVDSKPGQGATFRIYLPVLKEP
ncbi:MAG: PAS domain-containing protein [Phycisphaerales bacterium]|nr:MAG: PAS domain-containing protein [Phycisphaerales bacterium]